MTPAVPRVAIPIPTAGDDDYNARCWPQYAAAIARAGGAAVRVELAQEPAAIARIASTCSAVLLPGSPADVHPQKYEAAADPRTAPRDALREAADELLLQDAFNLHKPVFGICYGHQIMNVWKGGVLVQHLATGLPHEAGPTVEDAHGLVLHSGSRHLAAAFAGCSLRVNSSHHQAVEVPGDGLLVAATADGDAVIEAVEARDGFVVGVQWHPERSLAEDLPARRLFEGFVAAARLWTTPPVAGGPTNDTLQSAK